VSPLALIYVVLLVGGGYLLLVRPRRMQAQKAAALRSGLQPGDSVITVGGIYGIVDSTEGDDVLLEVSEGVVIRVAARAIATTLAHEEEEEYEDVDDDEDVDDEQLEAEEDDVAEAVAEPDDEPADRRTGG